MPADAPAVARTVQLRPVGAVNPSPDRPARLVMPSAITQSRDVVEFREAALAVALTVKGVVVVMLESNVSVPVPAVIFISSAVPLLKTLAVYPLDALDLRAGRQGQSGVVTYSCRRQSCPT